MLEKKIGVRGCGGPGPGVVGARNSQVNSTRGAFVCSYAELSYNMSAYAAGLEECEFISGTWKLEALLLMNPGQDTATRNPPAGP